MSSGDFLSVKDVNETILVGISFASIMGAETANSVVWSIETMPGFAVDATPGAVLTGSNQNGDAPIFKHYVTGGVDGALYKLKCTIVTNGGRTLVGTAYLPVRAV